MSTYVCPKSGNEEHIFGQGGVRAEAARMGVPFLGELPLSLAVRVAGDSGTPIAAGSGPAADAYARLATDIMDRGIVWAPASHIKRRKPDPTGRVPAPVC